MFPDYDSFYTVLCCRMCPLINRLRTALQTLSHLFLSVRLESSN